MFTCPSVLWRLAGVLAITLSGGCGGAAGGDADAGPDGDAPGDADVAADGGSDSDPNDGADAEEPEVDADPGPDADADADAEVREEWPVGVEVLGTGPAVGEGVLGPIFPFDLLIVSDLIVITGEARADFDWEGARIPAGGFVLALDRATAAYRWHRTIGDAVYAVAAIDDEFVIAGAFFGEIELSPARGGPISLAARGEGVVRPNDILVARIGLDGTFVWATRAGSEGFDGAFGVAVNQGRIAVVGYLSGEADLGDGCPLSVSPFPGAVDPVEGGLIGTWDGFVFFYDPADGTCIDGAVFGHEASDDFAFDIVAHGPGFAVSGEATLPLSSRTAAGVVAEVGGPETAGQAPFLLMLSAAGSLGETWFISPEGRGRGVASAGERLAWAAVVYGGGEFVGSGGPVPVEAGVSLIELSPGSARAWSLLGGNRTLDVMSAIAWGDGFVTGADRTDPQGTVLARIGADGARFHEGSASFVQPLRLAADGETIWAAGSAVGRGTLGEPPVTIDGGPQGGLVLLRLEDR